MNTKELKTLKQTKVSGVRTWDPTHYVCEVQWIENNGVSVPLTVYRHIALSPNGQNPVLLAGYGAYGTSHEPVFKPESLSLLQRGWILAVAHCRCVVAV